MKAIIFDLDGTIGNTLPLCIAAFKAAIEPHAGRTLTDQEIIDTFGPSEEGTVLALIPDAYDQGIEDYLVHYRALHHVCAKPFDGIVEILDWAKRSGIRLAMVTGKGQRSTDITLRVFGLDAYFEVIETGSPQGPRKVQGIEHVLKRLGIAPDEAIYVGDAPSDIDASREAGVPIVSAAWAETAESELLSAKAPDRLFTSVAEFRAYVERACVASSSS
ncbi:HAD family hydrolase [Paenibacillus methanolicus]|uniref:Phosphoglycolate phosphatase/pyrophosphatase PpaX n=1 Tax=Paenibacillus methanolicus TaxID=582686 RepID=A0A5S5C841_9BACL|nr:HAD family hydrolase [Paenibacillus methanolicus]TYP74500.1 phosphoglycolate phosphatase/pyrophosphatase PpaX [Paenibacillus methanolicus]